MKTQRNERTKLPKHSSLRRALIFLLSERVETSRRSVL